MAISPDWGLTSIVPMIEDVCARVAQLCQLTAEPVHSLNYLRDLRVAERDDTKLRVAHCGRDTPGAFAALTAVVDLIVDGIDQCHGLEPSGVEALLGAAEAAWEVRGQEARAVLLRAAENWEAICAVPAGLRYAS
ncbi:MAG: hypothetical protein WAW17_16325 [Rhodococcus sp. (in: high G+C Gram-positive bacteria)]|uniref:hypothetical protein n=1 Tax=Rhodococcus sp. TaxID=1831 RepID=UPI003BB0ACD5